MKTTLKRGVYSARQSNNRPSLSAGLMMAMAALSVTHSPGQVTDPQADALAGIAIRPSLTDPDITKYDFPHYLYVNRAIVVSHDPALPPDRHQLLLFIPGTHIPGTPYGGRGPTNFFDVAANLGYHVIYLDYPNDIAAAQACNNDHNPRAFEEFRMALIAGGNFKGQETSRTDCIENRLIKLLQYAARIRPLEKWDQFLTPGGEIQWSAIAVGGHSQGGGHAALIAVKHRVARVICTGSPKDYSHALHRPAAWYRETSATPKACFFAFNHDQDGMGNCTPAMQTANLSALGLDQFGPPADVDQESPPYHHTRILTTDYPGGTVDSLTAHGSVITSKNGDHFKDVWTYMLTEPVP